MQRPPFSAFIKDNPPGDLTEHLARWIEEYPSLRLPPVREISLALQISSRDVVSVFDNFRRNGLIETRQGSGSWPAGYLPPPIAFADIRPTPADLAQEIAERIRNGVYPTGSALPSAKDLAAQWNRHPQTVSRILDALVTDGTLERIGRNWVVPKPKPAKHAKNRHRILLVGAPDEHGALRMDSDREVEFWRDISIEASRNGLETSRFVWRSGTIEVPPDTLGLIVSTWHILDIDDLMRETASTRLPVCTWKEGLDDSGTPAVAAHPRLFVHEVAHSKRAGQEMAQHLLERGFCRVAWISPFGKARWSRIREEGLRETLDSEGVAFGSFSMDALTEWDFLAPAWSDPGLWKNLSTSALDALTDGRSRSIVAKAAQQLGFSRLARAWSDQLTDALAWKPDAIVASNDLAAIIAKEWMIGNGKWNPRDFALVGFDDSSEALRQDLTSYRFDTTSMSRSMLLQILSWRKERRISGRASRHGGAVVARGSTANHR